MNRSRKSAGLSLRLGAEFRWRLFSSRRGRGEYPGTVEETWLVMDAGNPNNPSQTPLSAYTTQAVPVSYENALDNLSEVLNQAIKAQLRMVQAQFKTYKKTLEATGAEARDAMNSSKTSS